MNKNLLALVKATIAVFCVGLTVATNAAFSATFSVTSSSCAGGAGTLSDALKTANNTAGPDIIDISPGLVITGDCDMGQSRYDPQLIVTETVTINGNGSLFHGANGYVDLSGNLNPKDTDGFCPSTSGKYILVGESQGLIQVGQRNTDNTGIELTIDDWKV
ncbi:MAG: hypothetical protein RLZZ602_233, partial [Pseudomonadota bacterium]